MTEEKGVTLNDVIVQILMIFVFVAVLGTLLLFSDNIDRWLFQGGLSDAEVKNLFDQCREKALESITEQNCHFRPDMISSTIIDCDGAAYRISVEKIKSNDSYKCSVREIERYKEFEVSLND